MKQKAERSDSAPTLAHLFMTVLVPLLQSRPRNLPLCSFTAAATLLVRSSLLSVIMSRVTLCWAVKAQGQGHSLDRLARWEHSRRSRGMLELSIRSSRGNNKLVTVGSHSLHRDDNKYQISRARGESAR